MAEELIHAESHARSIAKGISWRLVALVDTVIISVLVTGSITQALSIGLIETVFKVAAYYIHERMWQAYMRDKKMTNTILLVKSAVWRVFASAMTYVIAISIILIDEESIATGEASKAAGYIAGIEFVSKFILYYIHEKLWQKLPPGSIRERLDILKRDN